MSHLYVRFTLIKEISSQFTEKRPGKILTYVQALLQEQQYLPAEILENCDVLIFGGFENQKLGCPDKNGTVGRYGIYLLDKIIHSWCNRAWMICTCIKNSHYMIFMIHL